MRIQKAFEPVLENVINHFSRSFVEDLHSIYVYGSVAQGIAIIGQSDLDLCVVFKNKPKN
ncbi:MAG: nucleotidyltransferase domain-containing protein, partial [Acinetobacter sp.]|nr:nucleotidyltransferase domain-containing protein [Acinetobacter sp.]